MAARRDTDAAFVFESKRIISGKQRTSARTLRRTFSILWLSEGAGAGYFSQQGQASHEQSEQLTQSAHLQLSATHSCVQHWLDLSV